MAQILKRPPSAGERFASAIGAGVESAADEYAKYKELQKVEGEKKARHESVKKLFGEEFADLPPDLQDMYNKKLRGDEERSQKLTDKEEDFKKEKALKHMQFSHEKELKSMQEKATADKLSGENKEKEEPVAIAQKAFNRMASILKGGSIGRGSGFKSLFGGKTARDSGEFNSLNGALESVLVDKVSRGTLSNTRFEYIKNTLLPKPTDSDAEIEGKMKGLAEILGLDVSSLTGDGGEAQGKPKGMEKQSLEDIFQ